MKKFIAEFKEFAMKGNVVDMAIGVVIGGAFGKITTSLVNDIIMPLVSILTGGVDFSAWKWVLKEAVMEGSEVVDPEIAVNFGNLISGLTSKMGGLGQGVTGVISKLGSLGSSGTGILPETYKRAIPI